MLRTKVWDAYIVVLQQKAASQKLDINQHGVWRWKMEGTGGEKSERPKKPIFKEVWGMPNYTSGQGKSDNIHQWVTNETAVNVYAGSKEKSTTVFVKQRLCHGFVLHFSQCLRACPKKKKKPTELWGKYSQILTMIMCHTKYWRLSLLEFYKQCLCLVSFFLCIHKFHYVTAPISYVPRKILWN